MKRFFNNFPAGGKSSALVDWTVLLTGVLMLALSVAPVVTAKAEKIPGDALDRVEPGEDWLPS